ncbi:protein kinase domain-containing protein [Kitasatospora sp. NPDC003701]
MAGYRLRARLGAGGMGVVYLTYTRAGQPLALKVIRPEFALDPEFRRRFTQEVAAARQVQGAYTIPVVDSETDGAQPWLATAYVPAPSLARMLHAHGPLAVEPGILLLAGVAEALQSIHRAGVVHRDLKPSNVLLAGDGPKVIDFGIARAVDGTVITQTHVQVGSPGFMSPEQARGDTVSPATDVFSLGVLAQLALTGRHPFGEGHAPVMLYRVVHQEPDLTGCPPQLLDVLQACLAKDPGQRPSPAEIVERCARASRESQLRRTGQWLSPALAAEITVFSAAQHAHPPGPPTAVTEPRPAPTAPPLIPPLPTTAPSSAAPTVPTTGGASGANPARRKSRWTTSVLVGLGVGVVVGAVVYGTTRLVDDRGGDALPAPTVTVTREVTPSGSTGSPAVPSSGPPAVPSSGVPSPATSATGAGPTATTPGRTFLGDLTPLSGDKELTSGGGSVDGVDFPSSLLSNASTCGPYSNYFKGADYNLGKRWSRLTLTAGIEDNSSKPDGKIRIIGDGKVLVTRDLHLGRSEKLDLDVRGVLRLTVSYGADCNSEYGTVVFGDATLSAQ